MKKILFLAALLLTATQLWSANVDETEALAQAQRFLINQATKGHMMASAHSSLKLARVEKILHPQHQSITFSIATERLSSSRAKTVVSRFSPTATKLLM